MTSDRERLERACAGLQPPFACVDLDAFDANRAELAQVIGSWSSEAQLAERAQSLREAHGLAIAPQRARHGDGAIDATL